MKAKIIDVKKIVKSQKGGDGPSGGTPPKNIEGWDEEETGDETGTGEGGDEGDDSGSGEDDGKGKGSQEGGDESSGEGSGEGSGDGFREIDPADPGDGGYSAEVTPWKPPSGRTVVGEVLPTGSLGDGEKGSDTEEQKDKWKQATNAAEAQARGNMPAGVARALERMRQPVIDWKSELEKFIDEAMSKSKYTLPSRRFLGQGKAQYGYKKYKEDFESVVVAIDTSGSITKKMIEQFLAEVMGISEAYSPEETWILYCDTKVYEPDLVLPGDQPDFNKIKGGGGTRFGPPFEWTQKNFLDNGREPSVFIYFTDGEATFPDVNDYGINQYDDRCIWVLLTFNGERYRNEVPFGSRIDITLANKEIKTI
jgi:hypothetical protein